jgi:hypothetical protein
MHRSMGGTNVLARAVATSVAVALIAALQGCSDILRVDNPDEILAADLDDPIIIQQLANSAIGEFQTIFDDPIIWRGSMLTDEQITGINWEQTARFSRRIVRFDEPGASDNMFAVISRAIVMADTAAALLKDFVEDPSADERVATSLAFSGYSYLYLAETMCEATVKVSEEIYSPDAVMAMAVPRFEQAIEVAQNAGKQDLEYLARTGLARAHLWLNDGQAVMDVAGPVPSDFVYWASYSDNSDREENTF